MIQKFLDSLDFTADKIPIQKTQKELFERWLKNTYYLGAFPGCFGEVHLHRVTLKINELGYQTVEVLPQDMILITWHDQTKTLFGHKNKSYILMDY